MWKQKWTLIFVGLATSASILAAACGQNLSADPAPVRDEPSGVTAPVSGHGVEGPSDGAEGPITIIDDMDPNQCNFIHNINACFSDGQPPAEVPMGEYMDLYLKAAQDLGHSLGVDPALIKIKDVEKVEWPDASLGSPEPGMAYAQVVTPGFKMVLEADGQTYTYHTSMEHVVFVG